MTDGVTDEQFDEPLTAAKAEQNLSRANVVRKIRKHPSRSVTGTRCCIRRGASTTTGDREPSRQQGVPVPALARDPPQRPSKDPMILVHDLAVT